MKRKIEVFAGKQKENNTKVLTLLYDNEPLSAWQLAGMMASKGSVICLHAILNKRLRILEERDYVRRKDKKWHLRTKGIIAVLLILKEPRKWNPKWNEIFAKNAETLEEQSAKELKVSKIKIQNVLNEVGLQIGDFGTYVNLARKTKELMEKGTINFDRIEEQLLLINIIIRIDNLRQIVSILWNKENQEQSL
jgi:hypothetical protein